ncbi:fungal specific transcription factor domain-containing protein [Colletotrichum orchidophilum]|uniref:Fungal specific transcription factor domain-containing protein n=1 Tax=Colletotrichum orchidophilum TaxID=1209926 RepID=A0A1G4AS75_9PEZI|nr:fungal specific transcription factor domain-containing protein [Colletotrichum orchidophilum]OHE91882.1 fungal specific transcription factor domain-containing protein [Colletotrichum orchidophilum]
MAINGTTNDTRKSISLRAPNPPIENSVFKKFRLDRRTVIITGGARNIGSKVASGIAEAVANFTGRSPSSTTASKAAVFIVAAIAKDFGVKVKAYQFNVTGYPAFEAAVAEAVKDFGRLDVMIANAGVPFKAGGLDDEVKDWKRVREVDFDGECNYVRTVVLVFRQQRSGVGIIIASMSQRPCCKRPTGAEPLQCLQCRNNKPEELGNTGAENPGMLPQCGIAHQEPPEQSQSSLLPQNHVLSSTPFSSKSLSPAQAQRATTLDKPTNDAAHRDFNLLGAHPTDDFEWDQQETFTNYSASKAVLEADWNSEVIADPITGGMASLAVRERESGYLEVASGASAAIILTTAVQPDPNRHITDAMMDAYSRLYHLSYPIVHEATFRSQYAGVIPRPNGDCWLVPAYTARSILSFNFLDLGNLSLVQALTLICNYQKKRDKPNSGYNYLGLGSLTAISKSYPAETDGITPYTPVGTQASFHLATTPIYTRVFSKPLPFPAEMIHLEQDRLEPWLASVPPYFSETSRVPLKYALAHAVMNWRYRTLRIIKYGPFAICRALQARDRRPDDSSDDIWPFEMCLEEAKVAIISISEFWQRNEHNRLGARYAFNDVATSAAVAAAPAIRADYTTSLGNETKAAPSSAPEPIDESP